jgi:XTP/dITP diphosphohydrolase
MEQIIVATKNEGKVKDFDVLLSKYGISVRSLLDYPEINDIPETGTTFEENAIIKAEAVSNLVNEMVISDDSGLVVDALNGEPGVYSARYAGDEKDDQANIEKVLDKLHGVPFNKRSARFHCSLALAVPGKKTEVFTGTCEGMITEGIQGANGFGYDPIFYVESLKKTMAQLSKEEKNKISHRKHAMDKLIHRLQELLDG